MAQTLSELLPLLQKMAAEAQQPMSLTELAAELGKSPTHVQRVFARLLGESAKRYELRLRLERAALMLVCTRLSVLDVALEVGFGSHEGFTRAFRKHFEVGPRAFRQNHQHLDPAAVDRHASVVRHVGPCIGLYRMATKEPT